MKKFLALFRKTGYVVSYIFSFLVIALFFRIPRARGIIEEVFLEKDFNWDKGKRLYVSNHPSWLDQFFSLMLRLPYWRPDYSPYIAVANDSIKRIPFFRFLKFISFVIPIERTGIQPLAVSHIEKMNDLLSAGFSVMIAGAPGRDFKAREGETIYSPLKGKPLRKFTQLCGLLAIQPGVETIPFAIDGTQQIYREVEINGKKEMKFSFWRFFVRFWLLGKIKVKIIYGNPLVLEGKERAEATEIIQQNVLNLLDFC